MKVLKAGAKMKRILIAEDSPDQRQFLAESLIDEGYLVDTAVNGEVASKKLENNYYDLAVMDVRMPRKSGLAVLEELRKRKPAMPVILVSAFASNDDIERFKASGASAAMSKPFGFTELLKLIASFIKPGEECDRVIPTSGE